MKITVGVELQGSELQNAHMVMQSLEAFGGGVETQIKTDKDALSSRIREAISQNRLDSIMNEIVNRLRYPPVSGDCVDVICNTVLFNPQSMDAPGCIEKFVGMIAQLDEPHKEAAKGEVVRRAMTFLTMPRRHECSRLPLLPYAETLALMTRMDVLPSQKVLLSIIQLISTETTRAAGITCLGKLLEAFPDLVRFCDTQTSEALHRSLSTARQGSAFSYDVEYIVETIGWTQRKTALKRCRSTPEHNFPILALAYSGVGANTRECVVTSSGDGKICTWDGAGNLTENVILSRHYASSLDLANNGHALIVGSVGTKIHTNPAVVLYKEEITHNEMHWAESAAVEPENALFISVVRSFRYNSARTYCVGVSTNNAHSMLLYDATQLVQEYKHHHVDIITAMHIPSGYDSRVYTGSRDGTVNVSDPRTMQSTASFTPHKNTVSSITLSGESLITTSLDKRVVLSDNRMLTRQSVLFRDMDSPILDLSAHSMHCAITTLTGIYYIDFSDGVAAPCLRASLAGAPPAQYNALSWNSSGTSLYAGGASTTLDVFTRVFQEGDNFEGR